MSESKLLQYVPFNSYITPNFWFKLTEVKLDIDKLSEERKHVWGFYSNKIKAYSAAILEVDCTSFNVNFDSYPNLPAHGTLLNKNTLEQFKDCNKLELIDEEGLQLWNKIKNGDVLKNPSLLNSFFILSFADLKKYHYYYWFAFPTPNNINVVLNDKPKEVTDVFTSEEVASLMSGYNNLSDATQKTFFIVKKNSNNEINVFTLSAIIDLNSKDTNSFNPDNFYFGFSDPTMANSHPGWPLRNYLIALEYYCPMLHGQNINILSLRIKHEQGKFNCTNSIIFNVKLPEICGDFEDNIYKKPENVFHDSIWVGWERNEREKFGPRLSDMSKSMDPTTMAKNSVDLNLKLMKWRLLPDIDLDKIQNTRCLLLGSGTLGCSVARTLLGWGVRNITFVDNGRVSFSNPVRQSLFTHIDCLDGGKPKSKAAADNLKHIFPAIIATGHQLHIPMPGHPVGESTLQERKKDVATITELIKNHDIIFLLTDSRESRWLPTLLGAHFGKIVINAALGFDTYLVMRHGYRSDNSVVESENIPTGMKSIPGNELGCYFCNDITAPGNSLKDRTLDQQCTVTRPGISQIAGSLAVELAISILQHKNGALASAFYKTNNDNPEIDAPNECLLGILPHSIRGFLSTFSNVLPATERFKNCIACSDIVLNEYKKTEFEFLLQAFNSSKYLEDLTGLTEMYKESNIPEMWEIEDSDIEDIE